MKRPFSILLVFLLLLPLSSALAAKPKATPTPAPVQITEEVVEEVPEKIQHMLDIAYTEWETLEGKKLKKSNKYTKWWNNYEWGWCAGFVTWCMLEAGIPQQEKNKTPHEEVEGVVHVKEAGQGKLQDGYGYMNRLTRVPQKGFLVVYGNGKQFNGVPAGGSYHVGLVYDVEDLGDGKYRITTIEGNVDSPGDATHSKAGHTIRMYTRDYDLNAANANKKKEDLSLVPEEERTQEESALFSYDYTYGNPNLYINIFLMPWIPEE